MDQFRLKVLATEKQKKKISTAITFLGSSIFSRHSISLITNSCWHLSLCHHHEAMQHFSLNPADANDTSLNRVQSTHNFSLHM